MERDTPLRLPLTSVVIATRNRRSLLERTLGALAMQTCHPSTFEVVVADNGSGDGTSEMLSSMTAAWPYRLRALQVPRPGKSHAVNAAMARASGEFLALTDDDVEPAAEWMERLTAALQEPGCDFVAGRILPEWETTAPPWLSPSLYGVLAIADNGPARKPIARGVNEQIMPIGANMAVRASVVARVGGLRSDLGKLDGTLRTGEDHEFFLRLLHAGCRGVYEPAAVVRHHVPSSRLERAYFRRWLYQNGRDVAKLESSFANEAPRLLGVPRYLWRTGAGDLADLMRAAAVGDSPSRFTAETRLLWFAGYLRESWLGRASSPRWRLAEEP